MSVISLRDRRITLKVVYYGPAAGGKTTSLQQIHRILDPEEAVQLVTMATAGDKTRFFDFLPVSLGKIGNFRLHVQGFTVPGQVRYGMTRRFVLSGADGIIFVANSDPACTRENDESVADFHRNLRANGLDPETIPLAIQYNKRDLPEATPLEMLRKAVLFRPTPEFESVAMDGTGVYGAFRSVVVQMAEQIAPKAKVSLDEAVASVEEQLARHVDASLSLGPAGAGHSIALPGLEEPPPGDSEELPKRAIDSGVELSRLYAEVGSMKERLEAAMDVANIQNRLAKRMLEINGVDDMWRELSEAVRARVACPRSTLLRRVEGNGGLEPVELIGHDTDPLVAALGDQAAVFLGHLEEPAHFGDDIAHEVMRSISRADPTVRGALISPVQVRGDVAGALVLYRGEDDPPFDLRDTRFASTAGNLAALGLGRALREEDVVQMNRDLEARIRKRTSRLSAALMENRRLNLTLEDRVHQRNAALDRATSALRRTEEYLLQAEKMSSLARLASGIAHEINNPMAYVQGNLEALGEYVEDFEKTFRRLESATSEGAAGDALAIARLALDDPALRSAREDLSSLVDETKEGASRVVEIAKGIRNLAHLNTGDQESVHLADQVENALNILSRKLGPGMEVVREFGDTPPVSGFPVLITQMFLNIIVNAADACDGRGRITIRIREEDDVAVVEISDTGPGIPRDALSHIFEPFFTTKEVGRGTGLGLYTVYQIAERHGGEMGVDTASGEGTTFRIRLPFLPAVERVGSEEES